MAIKIEIETTEEGAKRLQELISSGELKEICGYQITFFEMKSPLAQRAEKELRIALREFGRYLFFDKGPREIMVMEIYDISDEFKRQGVEASIEAFKEILKIPEYGETLASSILYELQEWEELWEGNESFLGSFL